MLKKTPGLNLLQSEKQLLIAESELNRVQIMGDIETMKAGAVALSGHIKTFGSISSSAAVIVAGLTAFQTIKPAGDASKPSWVQTAIKGAGVLSTLWLAYRSRGGDHKETN